MIIRTLGVVITGKLSPHPLEGVGNLWHERSGSRRPHLAEPGAERHGDAANSKTSAPAAIGPGGARAVISNRNPSLFIGRSSRLLSALVWWICQPQHFSTQHTAPSDAHPGFVPHIYQDKSSLVARPVPVFRVRLADHPTLSLSDDEVNMYPAASCLFQAIADC